MGLIKYIRSRVSMTKLYSLFWDSVNGKPVYLWHDKYGVYWLAQSKWGFRTKSTLNNFKYY